VEAKLRKSRKPGVLTVKDHLQELKPEESVEFSSSWRKSQPPKETQGGAQSLTCVLRMDPTVNQYYEEDVFAKKGEERASGSRRAKQKIRR
jgi:hypothetical protein